MISSGMSFCKINSKWRIFFPISTLLPEAFFLPTLKWEGHQKGLRKKNHKNKNLADPENTTWIF